MVRMDRMQPVLMALSRYTSIPPAVEDDGRDVAAHYPSVGWVTGAAAAASFALVSIALPDIVFAPLVAAAISIAVGIAFTGARHEDSFGRFAASSRAAITGAPQTFATAMVLLALLAKAAFLAMFASRSPTVVLVIIICAQVLSRVWPLTLEADEATKAPHLDFANRRGWALCIVWALPTLPLALLAHGFIWYALGLLVSGLALLAVRKFVRAGAAAAEPAFGAAQLMSEFGFYLGAAIGLMLR